MDHGYIDQYDLVERYLMGKLPDEERARFEDHYADCPECFDRLKITRNFIEDLQSPAARQALQLDNYTIERTHLPFAYLSSPRTMILAASFVLTIIIAGIIVSIVFIQNLRSDVNQARNEAAEWQHNYEEARESADELSRRFEEREQELTERLRALETRTQDTQGASGERTAESGLWIQPKINPLIFSLKSVNRSANHAATTNEIKLPARPDGFLISMGLESDVSYTDYQVTIINDRGATVIKGKGFKRSSDNALSIGLNSKLFQSGDYLLKVDGITKGGDATLIGNYPFRIIKSR